MKREINIYIYIRDICIYAVDTVMVLINVQYNGFDK